MLCPLSCSALSFLASKASKFLSENEPRWVQPELEHVVRIRALIATTAEAGLRMIATVGMNSSRVVSSCRRRTRQLAFFISGQAMPAYVKILGSRLRAFSPG